MSFPKVVWLLGRQLSERKKLNPGSKAGPYLIYLGFLYRCAGLGESGATCNV
jgi:hypothetical protein